MENKTFGRYRLLDELGRGAMGAVYRAVDPLIEREVAIKTLLPNLPTEVMEEVRERFLREARSAGRLNHPNIVTIYDVGEENGVAYIAMELLEGRSLQQILREPEPLSWHAVADIAAQVADALDHAQQFAIVHRDVKPANVMVASSGRAKLTDFGVAYIPSSTMTQTGTALGSPRYMSPEQVLGLPIDPRSDIFSLGVVLYEMLTRRTPFERPGDSTVFALMNRIAGEPHVPLHAVNPKIPAAYEAIIQRALAKKPDQRYQRAGEMAAALRRVDQSGQASATEYEKTQVLNRPAMPARPAPPPAYDEQTSRELLTDLDAFTRNFEREERARLRAEEEARLRREQELQRWAEIEARKREAYDRERAIPAQGAAATDPGSKTSGSRAALDMLRKQAASMPKREDPAVARTRAIKELDKGMRAAFQYLAEFGHELSEVRPAASKPYEFIYVGRLPRVTLSDAFVDSRPVRLEGEDMCQHIFMRYRVTPTEPARVTLLGADIERAPQYLKSLRVAFDFKPEAKNDFGQTTRAVFVVSGALPCQVDIRADYETFELQVEMVNVRVPGRVECRLTAQQLGEAIDELARYVLGVDDSFARYRKR